MGEFSSNNRKVGEKAYSRIFILAIVDDDVARLYFVFILFYHVVFQEIRLFNYVLGPRRIPRT